jgi:hypothetical protein
MKKCPLCKGKGELSEPLRFGHRVIDNSVMAKLLRKEGYSLREIMRFLQYNSPNSVAKLLKKK